MKGITGKKELLTLIIALIASFLLWVYANISQNPEIIKVIEVIPEYRNAPANFRISNLKRSIDLYISGKRINLIKAINTGLNLYHVSYDLSNITAGENKIKPIINEMFSLSFKVIKTNPEFQTVMAHKIEEKEVLVTNTLSGKPKAGYYVKSMFSSPPTVKVKGLESTIEKVTRVEGNKSIDLNGLSENRVVPLMLKAFNSQQEIVEDVSIDPPRVMFNIDVRKFKKRSVPVNLVLKDSLPHGYELVSFSVTPEYVDLLGPDDKVDKAEPFLIPYSLNNLKSDIEEDKKLVCGDDEEYYFSDYTKNMLCRISLKVMEKQLEKKFFKLPLNSIFNQRKDYFYRIDAPSTVDVRISGPELLVERVFSSEVIPYIDVDKTEAGDWTLTVEADLPKGVNLVRLYPVNAKITIVKNKEDEGENK